MVGHRKLGGSGVGPVGLDDVIRVLEPRLTELRLAPTTPAGGAVYVAALEAAHPGQTAPLADYPARFADTIREPIAGTWALIDRLSATGHRLFAITNFAAYTWPVALELHPRLGTCFEHTVVSGHAQVLKPDPAIYRLLLERNALDPGDCLFIDDSPANVAGARAVGMAAHHFTTSRGLAEALAQRGLL